MSGTFCVPALPFLGIQAAWHSRHLADEAVFISSPIRKTGS